MTNATRRMRALAERAGAELAEAPAEDVVRWAAQTFADRWVVAASMTDTALAHMASRVAPGVTVLFIDTGHHFPETLATRDEVAREYDVRLQTVAPQLTTAAQDMVYGPRLWQRDPDRCCALRKVEPLNRALAGYDPRSGRWPDTAKTECGIHR